MKRRAELRRKTPMKPGGPISRSAWLESSAPPPRRRGLRPISAKRARENKERRRVMIDHFGTDPVCQRCGSAPADHVHELLPRSAGGSITDPTNCRAVCFTCHRAIHDDPEAAYRDGWLIRSTDA